MEAVRQRCRPKHQVLVLKCYPKHQKNQTDVKPNSSELSYLLYYASTRRSKLQKVGDFLDKRTTRDVSKGRIGNVQVTLQMLKALIEKTPRDLPLYVAAVLRIFRTILNSKDVTMVEETVPTFETFCAHQDPANLAADQDYLHQYEDIIRMYAAFASKDTPIETKTVKSVPVLMRFRKAGLDAIKAIAASESLSAETARQLRHIVPPILENIYSESGKYLGLLGATEEQKAETEKQMAIRRRQSTSTVRTVEEPEADPIAASGTTEAADRLAEQETGVVALQALKKIFAMVPRGQLRLATAEVLKFMAARIRPRDHFPPSTMTALQNNSWPCTLFGMICQWAPVQDRYVILVTAMEALIRSPILEEDMEKQYVLATIIGWLLSSDINFIGLSVMDVLVGLIQHILLLLQLGGQGTNIHPHGQQTDVINAADFAGEPTTASANNEVVMEVVELPTTARKSLIKQLQRCIGSLAVHVYYSDQIADMVAAILARLKPSPLSQVPTAASAIENPQDAVAAIASSASLSEKPNTDGFFSFETARVAALGAIQEILTWANWTKSDGTSNRSVRSPVTVMQWEGTQWLLRDPNWEGRAAYVETLLIWMKYEVKKKDLRADHDKKASKPEKKDGAANTLAKRAVSNASNRDRSPLRRKHTFLQLLHLAVYENAHQYAENDYDILLLHLLLSHLVQKLGVNAVQHGLPMIMRLQEDIASIESPRAKINVGSLVHAYLWAVSSYFDFDASVTGREIQNEISRRMGHAMWLDGLSVPPMPFDRIMQREKYPEEQPLPPEVVRSEALRPFDNRAVLIDKIAQGYSIAVYSPPSSPPSSPGRQFSVPFLNTMAHPPPPPSPKVATQLPQKVKDSLLLEWTREACVAATTKSEGSRSGSLSGSPAATQSGSRHLAVNMSASGANGDVAQPTHRSHHSHLRGANQRPTSAGAYGPMHPAGGMAKPRSRHTSASPTPVTSSSLRSAVRVEDLKRVLSGSQSAYPVLASSHGIRADMDGEDTSSESVISYEDSSVSYANSNVNRESVGTTDGIDRADHVVSRDGFAPTDGSMTPRPLTAASIAQAQAQHSAPREPEPQHGEDTESDGVPPVPPIPDILKAHNPAQAPPAATSAPTQPSFSTKFNPGSPRAVSIIAASERSRPRTAGSIPTGGGARSFSAAFSSAGDPFNAAKDVWGFSAREFLESIDADGSGAGSPGGLGSRAGVKSPPY